MKAASGVVELLNHQLGHELVAINQLFLHARICKNWGLDELNEKEYKHSIHAMKRADDLIERILLLEGLPNLQNLGKIFIGEDVEEILKMDLQAVTSMTEDVRGAISHCEKAQDYVSREMLDGFLGAYEEWIDDIETQTELIQRVGRQNYQQSMM